MEKLSHRVEVQGYLLVAGNISRQPNDNYVSIWINPLLRRAQGFFLGAAALLAAVVHDARRKEVCDAG